jgi:hypothetical protein
MANAAKLIAARFCQSFGGQPPIGIGAAIVRSQKKIAAARNHFKLLSGARNATASPVGATALSKEGPAAAPRGQWRRAELPSHAKASCATEPTKAPQESKTQSTRAQSRSRKTTTRRPHSAVDAKPDIAPYKSRDRGKRELETCTPDRFLLDQDNKASGERKIAQSACRSQITDIKWTTPSSF